MALQILRYANAPTSLPGFENQLAAALDDVHSGPFREVEAHFQQRLMVDMARRATEFKPLSGVALFSAATGGRGHSQSRPFDRTQRTSGVFGEQPRDLRDEAGIDDMALRLVHLGVLHWRVWAPLAYEGDIESELSALQNQAMR
jgi:hypothetical protein